MHLLFSATMGGLAMLGFPWSLKTNKEIKPVGDPVFEALAVKHICPDCGGAEFLMGPQGGASQNVKCANDKCGSKFNLAPFEDGKWFDTPMIAERI